MIKEFFEKNLPSPVLPLLDLDSIVAQKDSFVGDNLKLQSADLLFTVNFRADAGHKSPAYLYTLIENASSPDPLPPFRMLKYVVAIMEDHLEKTKKEKGAKAPALPLILPFVIYSGSKPLGHTLDLFALFGPNSSLAKALWTEPATLINLSETSDEELARYRWFGAAALAAKHIHFLGSPGFEALLLRLLGTLPSLAPHKQWDYINIVVTYLAEAGNIPDKEVFARAIQTTFTEEQGVNLIEQFRQEGLQMGLEKGKLEGLKEGVEKGKLEALHEIAFKLLNEGIPLEQVSKLTDLSLSDLQSLRRKTGH